MILNCILYWNMFSTALIKCSLLNAIETGNFISSPVIDTTIKPRRSKSEIKQRSSLDPSLHRRSMSRANHYKETRTQRTSLGSNYRRFCDLFHSFRQPLSFSVITTLNIIKLFPSSSHATKKSATGSSIQASPLRMQLTIHHMVITWSNKI